MFTDRERINMASKFVAKGSYYDAETYLLPLPSHQTPKDLIMDMLQDKAPPLEILNLLGEWASILPFEEPPSTMLDSINKELRDTLL